MGPAAEQLSWAEWHPPAQGTGPEGSLRLWDPVLTLLPPGLILYEA